MILFVAADSPWPATTGGRVRMAGLVGALGRHEQVVVAVARGSGSSAIGPDVEPLPLCGRSRWSALLGAGPRLGRGLLDAAATGRIRELAGEARLVVVSHSYLAPLLPDLDVPVVVDFQNVEVQRQATGGLLGHLESVKARRWEPTVARRADVCVAVDEQDAAVLHGWGAWSVVVVPNAIDVDPSPPSPSVGPVLAVADWHYAPNADGLQQLQQEVWPRVLASRPGAQLVLAGRGSEQHPGGLGLVDDLTPVYDGAVAVVVPVRRGAGTQLKVREAVARGRVVVTNDYGARSLPAGAAAHCLVGRRPADLAAHVVRLLDDPVDRHRREQSLLAASPGRSWDEAVSPLWSRLAAVPDG